jgi:hypothetical protein
MQTQELSSIKHTSPKAQVGGRETILIKREFFPNDRTTWLTTSASPTAWGRYDVDVARSSYDRVEAALAAALNSAATVARVKIG